MRNRGERQHGRAEKERLIDAVVAARLRKGISQRELSTLVGLHPMAIMRFDRGERVLDVLELIDIARVLDVDPVDLLRATMGE